MHNILSLKNLHSLQKQIDLIYLSSSQSLGCNCCPLHIILQSNCDKLNTVAQLSLKIIEHVMSFLFYGVLWSLYRQIVILYTKWQIFRIGTVHNAEGL